jgi:DNA-binding LacI/PurR family transcriptional regulator
MGVQRALWERRMSAPEHVSYLAIGTANGLEAFMTPSVTTIEWDRGEETRLAFAAIAGKWPSKKRHIQLQPKLLPLNSTGPAPGTSRFSKKKI